MFPTELVILMAIAETRNISQESLTRPTDIPGEYIGYLYNSLVRRGYIRRNNSRGYQLTDNGRESLFEFVRGSRKRCGGAVKTLQRLGIDIGQEMDKLEKEAIKVK